MILEDGYSDGEPEPEDPDNLNVPDAPELLQDAADAGEECPF